MSDLWHVVDQVRINESPTALSITVHPHFNGGTFFFSAAVGGLWLFIGGIYLVGALFEVSSISGALFAIFLWLIGPIAAAIQLLWMFYGEERLTVTDEYLIKSSAIKSWKHSTRYRRDKVSNVRETPRGDRFGSSISDKKRYDPRSGGHVAFDYRGRMVTYGKELSDADTQRVIAALNNKLNTGTGTT